MAQNHRRAKLRGKSFRGQNLTGADFSYSDIRGADFTGAILKGVNFSHVRAGLQRRWVIFLVVFSFILSALSGFLSAVGSSLIGFLLIQPNRENFYVGVISLVVLSVFFLLTVRRGAASAFGFLMLSVIVAGLAAVLWAGLIAVSWAGVANNTGAMQLATVVAVIVTGAVSVIVVAMGTVIIAGAAALAGAVAGLFALTLNVLVAGLLAGAVAVIAIKVGTIAAAVAVAVSACVILLSSHIACRALFEDEKQNWVRSISISMATAMGTNFQNADLTDADFTQARLKNTNFNNATIRRTCWFNVKDLHLALLGQSYLASEKIRQILVTKDLSNQNFDGWDLQGINLQGANLKDGTFVAAKLNESNLEGADISRAKLVKAQLNRASLRGALLTGAYIEDWRINSETNFDGVRCDYIFLRVPTKENPNPRRQPANWDETFKVGEFTKLISPFVNVVRVRS